MDAEYVRKKGFYLDDLKACNLCLNYTFVGRIGGDDFCQSEESPYYEPPKKGYPFRGTHIEWWNELRGCEQFSHNGDKIPSEKFKSVPSDSILRTLPPKRIIKGFRDGLDIEPYISTQDIIDKAIDRDIYVDGLLKTGKTADELKAAYPMLLFVDGLLVSYDIRYKKIIKIYFEDKLGKRAS